MSADRRPAEPGLVDVAVGYALVAGIILLVAVTLAVLGWRMVTA